MSAEETERADDASPGGPPRPHEPRRELERAVRHVGHLLPAQGPISVFIHHNTLHAFEDRPFEAAAVESARLFGCEPFLPEARYREELARGRIGRADLKAELASELGERGEEPLVGAMKRRDLRKRVLVHGIPEVTGPALSWLLRESTARTELRADLPTDALEALGASGPRGPRREEEEARWVGELWSACQGAIERSGSVAPSALSPLLRHRDLLLAAFELDVDEQVHPVLIRLASAYLDQGLADWPMPSRERGFFACFLDLYRGRAARLCRPFGAELAGVVSGELAASRDAPASLEASLASLGVPSSEWEPFLTAEALALRGFAGMFHQFELRPDRVPAFVVPARLLDFLAVRLLLVRAAVEHAARRIGFEGELAALRPWLSERRPPPPPEPLEERAFRLFHVAQLCGLDARAVDGLDAAAVAKVEAELREFDSTARRQIFHLAYERHLRHRFFDALSGHRSEEPPAPRFQAIFCIDEREESVRRHLEEVAPDVETFGAVGFFGVAMYYRGATDAHPRPLCPVAIRPRHYVVEVDAATEPSLGVRWLRGWEKLGALVNKNIHLGGRRAGRGAVLMATLGVLWVLPLVLKVVFPWLLQGAAKLYGRLHRSAGRSLRLEHVEGEGAAPLGAQAGFTIAEMAEIVEGLLSPLGIRDRFAPLVLVLGHGSASLNNPHKSAYDCGACGGGRGGPNALAFAQMANHPEVRASLRARGLSIPEEVWFVGGQRNTANSDVELFDEERVPAALRPLLERARAALTEARAREAHERCRRFESAPLWLPRFGALLHVQARATDLAQPRPECGHATNAMCFIGRRARTRGLFLDRRCFLVSYDPELDPDGALLGGLLAAVVPVVAGINLEYLFGYIDPTGYGCGTKLPHNVTGLVGVMDGAESDLRTGLPWQMLEIHEPVRLSIVVEAQASVLERLVEEDERLRSLVHNRWIFLASLDPSSGALHELDARGLRAYAPEQPLRAVGGASRGHYQGRRGHLPFVRIEGEAGGRA